MTTSRARPSTSGEKEWREEERKPPVSHHGYLVKACPEHLRSATNDEKFILTDYIADIMDSKNDIEKNKAQGL
jgi:hypothetical protein